MLKSQARREVLEVLGLLACAREPLTLNVLGQFFGREAADRMEDLLTVAADFFGGRPAGRAPDAPFRFFHSRFPEFILKQAVDFQAELHAQIANACLRWRELDSDACRYALRYLPTHLREAQKWDDLCDALTDFDYLQTRIILPDTRAFHDSYFSTRFFTALTSHTPSGLVTVGDAHRIATLPSSIFDLMRDFYDALTALPANHPMREQVAALYRAIDGNSHALKEDPSLLVQQVYNTLVWDWSKRTKLGRRMRDIARRYNRTWLKQLNRPAVSAHPALIRTLLAHRWGVNSVAFSPNGKILVSGADGNGTKAKTLALWDTKTGELKRILMDADESDWGSDWVYSTAFSPDSKTLASGCMTLKLWDVQTGELKQNLAGHSDNVRSVAFSPDGKTVASGSGGTEDGKYCGEVKLWDAETGRLKRTLADYETAWNSVAFSPDGKFLASGGDGGMLILWDAETGAQKWILRGDNFKVSSVAFSSDGKFLASGGTTLKLWDVQRGKLKRLFRGHAYWVHSVTFSPDSKTVVSGGNDEMLRLWDAQKGQLKGNLIAHSRDINAVAFSPDGKTLASGSSDGTVKLWETVNLCNPHLRRWKLALTGHKATVSSGTFSSDGKILATGSFDKTLKLWDVKRGNLKLALRAGDAVLSIAFSPDGMTLASGFRKVELWDPRSGNLNRVLTGHNAAVCSIAFSPDGMTLASGSYDKEMKLWDARTGKLKLMLTGHNAAVRSVAFSPDGKTVVSGSGTGGFKTGDYYGEVKLWDAETGRLKRTLMGQKAGDSVAFSPDGITLATVGDTVNLWHARTGNLKLTLTGHETQVDLVAFSPDGRTLVSRCRRTVRLCDTKTGEMLASLPCEDNIVAIWFDPKLPQLRVADAGGAAHVPNIYVLEIVRPGVNKPG